MPKHATMTQEQLDAAQESPETLDFAAKLARAIAKTMQKTAQDERKEWEVNDLAAAMCAALCKTVIGIETQLVPGFGSLVQNTLNGALETMGEAKAKIRAGVDDDHA